MPWTKRNSRKILNASGPECKAPAQSTLRIARGDLCFAAGDLRAEPCKTFASLSPSRPISSSNRSRVPKSSGPVLHHNRTRQIPQPAPPFFMNCGFTLRNLAPISACPRRRVRVLLSSPSSFRLSRVLAARHSSLATSSVSNRFSTQDVPSNPRRINLFHKTGATLTPALVGAGLPSSPRHCVATTPSTERITRAPQTTTPHPM